MTIRARLLACLAALPVALAGLSAASHSLAQEAGDLSQLVNRFQVGDDNRIAPIMHTPRASAGAPRPALNSMSTQGAGGGAQQKTDDDTWEEF